MNDKYITNEAEVALPPLQWARKAVWDYYRIEFLPSGYPGRRQAGELNAHPIYGTYVISDYLAQYRNTKDETYLKAAQKVADSAISQMEQVGDGLAFMYRPEGTGVSLRQQEFYSGLTQSRYAEVLSKLQSVSTGQKYAEALKAVLASLTVPLADGGVAAYTPSGGLVIEEYPSTIPDLTLNGWTTATTILANLSRLKSGEAVKDILEASIRGMEDLVGLYDVPELSNSRYRLTGPAEFFARAEDADFKILECSVEMPGYGSFSASSIGEPGAAGKGSIPSRIGNTAMGTPAREKHFVAQLSRATWPRKNILHISLDVSEPTNLVINVGTGEYDPLSVMLDVSGERTIGKFELYRGSNSLEVEVPWHMAELVSYPTNFRKKIAGIHFNQYHFIHVDTLRKIADYSKSEVLGYFAERWSDYPANWADLAAYRDSDISLERFDPKKHK